MGMFLNYENIAKNYTPNNLMCAFPVGKSYTKLDPIQASRPYEEYNAKGELIGYFWRYGETLNLEFNIDGEIVVEDDAIVLSARDQIPSSAVGRLGQRAYNVIDKRSWTCSSIHNEVHVWTEDKEFTYREEGQSVYVTAEDYLADKQVEVTLYNFRMEPIHTEIFAGKSKVILAITPELSKKLLRGIYHCSLNVFNDSVNLPIFSSTDCTLLVK